MFLFKYIPVISYCFVKYSIVSTFSTEKSAITNKFSHKQQKLYRIFIEKNRIQVIISDSSTSIVLLKK